MAGFYIRIDELIDETTALIDFVTTPKDGDLTLQVHEYKIYTLSNIGQNPPHAVNTSVLAR